MARITIDPVTRIEGHLRVDVEVENGYVTKAWSSAQMFRGIETILQGRDPRDAWVFAQRFCGVCTSVHAMGAVRAVEDALGVEVPLNAQYMRNLLITSHTLQDNIVHFYHLSALDWVDIVSALRADPVKAASIAQSTSNWAGNTAAAFAAAKDRLAKFVATGKLGIFGSGYWGHPAMQLSPELNLIIFSHYLIALDYQRKASQAQAIIGGKDPHPQNFLVGGVATAINVDNPATFNMERIAYMRQLLGEIKQFVDEVYLPDTILIGNGYKDWFNYGAGVVDYMSVPELPLDSRATTFMEKGGIIRNGDLSTFREIKDWKDKEYRTKITENTDHAWYEKNSSLHPWDGDSKPKYTDFQDDGKYTWCKAPRYDGKPYQVGPVAQILAAYAAKDKKTVDLVNSCLSKLNVGIAKMHSTMGRQVTRAIRCAIHADRALDNLQLLEENIAKGDQTYANPVTKLTNSKEKGVGIYEAPRGALSHWVVIDDGKIKNYQAVVPSTWNAGPRDKQGNAGPYEASLVRTPVADAEKPLEVIRTVHSFDPCIACAVHTIDPQGREIVNITVD